MKNSLNRFTSRNVAILKVDKRGNPIVAKTRELTYMIDLFMVDGIYYFSTDEIDSEYRSMISEVVKDNVMK